MNTNFYKIFLFTLLFFSTYSAHSENFASDPMVQYVETTIKNFMDKNNIEGVDLEIINNGKPFSFHFGYTNKDKKTPITGQTIFEIGSITKVFTALLLAEEVNSNKMKLIDPVTKYLPITPSSDADIKNVTLKNLATHTASLPFKPAGNIDDIKKLYAELTTWKAPVPVGSQWQYSNYGIGLLGIVLENMTHKSYTDLLQQKILNPLGMRSTGFNITANVAQGYDKNNNIADPVKIKLFPQAGALKSSGKDMLRFLQAALQSSNTPKDIKATMELTQTPFVETPDKQQGLGWDIYTPLMQHKKDFTHQPTHWGLPPITTAIQLNKNQQSPDVSNLIEKTGATDGFRAYIGFIPNHNSGIVLLINRQLSNNTLVNAARDLLLKISGDVLS